jgi:hypothetical protein
MSCQAAREGEGAGQGDPAGLVPVRLDRKTIRGARALRVASGICWRRWPAPRHRLNGSSRAMVSHLLLLPAASK